MIDIHFDEAYFNQSFVTDDDILHNFFTIILKFHHQLLLKNSILIDRIWHLKN